MAEARSAVAEPRVQELDEGRDSWKDIAKAWKTSILRFFFRTRNSIRNGMWPSSMSNLTFAVSVFLAFLIVEPQLTTWINQSLWSVRDPLHIPKGLPRSLQALCIASLAGFIFIILLMIIRQYLLRILLAYRGWMYAPAAGQSKSTLLWCLAVKLVSGYQPSLYSCQRSLPRLPVPPLKETIRQLLESLEPLTTQEELTLLRKQAKEFEETTGPKLQKILLLKSWISQNYVTDWWEKYVYLRSRLPLAINSNYYCLDQSYWNPTNSPVCRAATVIHNCLLFKRLVDREELPPLMLRNTVPVCMAQYERMFSTARVPGEDMDELRHFETKDSKHVVVYCKGLYYKLDVYDEQNRLLCPYTLRKKLQWIIDDATKHQDETSEEEKRVASLTGLGRSEWAKIRRKYLRSGVNKETLDIIESSIFFFAFSDENRETLTERGQFLLAGDGKSIWFDKSISMVVFANASIGMNCEHSHADAPVMAHMWEYALTKEVMEKQYDENGLCMPMPKSHRFKDTREPQRLVWEVNEGLREEIRQATQFNIKNQEDLDLLVFDHDSWGKGVIKKCRISPDAFIQMALQLTYYRLSSGKLALTYEASMTRMYLCGRTETVRSCTNEVANFIKAMESEEVSKEERIRLMRMAADKHQKLYRDGMNGKGIDRHLFALFVACKGLRYDSAFLQSILSQPWTLSTSQTPHTQLTNVPSAEMQVFANKLCPGGGFGPVSDEGYGTSYLFPNDQKIFFHISSKRSCKATDSKRFLDQMIRSMDDMKNLFQ